MAFCNIYLHCFRQLIGAATIICYEKFTTRLQPFLSRDENSHKIESISMHQYKKLLAHYELGYFHTRPHRFSCRHVNTRAYYSGTPPYDQPVYKTTSLLRPYSFKPNVKTIDSFYYFEDPVNATTSLLRPGFYGPTVVAFTGFHCNQKLHKTSQKVNLQKSLQKVISYPQCEELCPCYK